MGDLARDLARATRVTASAVSALRGCGDGLRVDALAVEVLRSELAKLEFDGLVVIGEGQKDGAPMLDAGERVGGGAGPQVDLAVDPVDGTRCVAEDRRGALVVVGACERGRMRPLPSFYAHKVATRIDAVDPRASVGEMVGLATSQLGRVPRVAVLERPRNAALIEALRVAGAELERLTDADVDATLCACLPGGGVDILIGVGGAPEAMATACAAAALGAQMHCRAWPEGSELLGLADLVGGGTMAFAATAITATRVLAPGESISIDGDGVRRFP
jgi:fructose-1,6-bisphosphatase II